MEDVTTRHEIYLKKSEHISISMVDIEWLRERLEPEEFLTLEEEISLCTIQNHEEFFNVGFDCALELLKDDSLML